MALAPIAADGEAKREYVALFHQYVGANLRFFHQPTSQLFLVLKTEHLAEVLNLPLYSKSPCLPQMPSLLRDRRKLADGVVPAQVGVVVLLLLPLEFDLVVVGDRPLLACLE